MIGADPLELYETLCVATGTRQDPCVLDVFMSVTDFLGGAAPKPWWHFTQLRRQRYGHLVPAAAGRSLPAKPSSKPKPRRRPA